MFYADQQRNRAYFKNFCAVLSMADENQARHRPGGFWPGAMVGRIRRLCEPATAASLHR